MASTPTVKTNYTAGLFALFIASGTFKASPVLSGLPDLTLVSAIGITLAAAFRLLVRPRSIESALWWTAGIAFAFSFGLFDAIDSDYGQSKVVALFTLTLGCSFAAPLLLISSDAHRRALVWATVVVGLATLALYTLAPTTETDLIGRAALAGSNTIVPGRLAGAGFVAVATLMITRSARPIVAVPIMAILAALIIDTGSRGPIAAVTVALAVVVACLTLHGRGRGRTIIGALVALGIGYWSFANADQSVRERLLLVFADDRGRSVNLREFMWSRAVDVVQSHIAGIGWGSLSRVTNPIADYPHNIFLEVTAEGGWVAGAGLLLILVGAYKRAYFKAAADDPMALCLMAVMTFWLVNALVSGDINDNRGVFVYAAACLALTKTRDGTFEDRPPRRSQSVQTP